MSKRKYRRLTQRYNVADRAAARRALIVLVLTAQDELERAIAFGARDGNGHMLEVQADLARATDAAVARFHTLVQRLHEIGVSDEP